MHKCLIANLRMKADMIELGEKIAWGSEVALMRDAAAALEKSNKHPYAEPVTIRTENAFSVPDGPLKIQPSQNCSHVFDTSMNEHTRRCCKCGENPSKAPDTLDPEAQHAYNAKMKQEIDEIPIKTTGGNDA